jgi:hypothetical protein
VRLGVVQQAIAGEVDDEIIGDALARVEPELRPEVSRQTFPRSR